MGKRARIAVAVAGGAAGCLVIGATIVAWDIHQTPGGFEEWIGDNVSDLRQRFPVLIEPIETAELWVQDVHYRFDLWRRGETEALSDVPEAVAIDGPPVPPVAAPPVPPVPTGGADVAQATVDSEPVEAAIATPSDRPPTPVTRGRKAWWFGVDEPEKAAAAQLAAMQIAPVSWQPHPQGPAWLSVGTVVANSAFADEPATALKLTRDAVRVHWQPGAYHPWLTGRDHQPRSDASPAPDRSGRVPNEVRSTPIVAFGGGFESLHFQEYGAMWNGHPVVPLAEGIQTLAIDAEGHPMLGPWGTLPEAAVVDARQNLPPLLHDGRIPDNIGWLNVGTLKARWTTDDQNRRIYADVHTWRSAVGLTAEGDLVYVAGGRLSPGQLAGALLAAGAIEGMQLDINAAYHCAPTLFLPKSGSKMKVIGLVPGVDSGVRFLDGSRKDFFWISGVDAPSVVRSPPDPTPPPS